MGKEAHQSMGSLEMAARSEEPSDLEKIVLIFCLFRPSIADLGTSARTARPSPDPAKPALLILAHLQR